MTENAKARADLLVRQVAAQAEPGVGPVALCAPAIAGESLASQVSRYHIASGNPTTRQTYQELFGRAPFSLTSWIPSYLSPLMRWLDDEPAEVMHRLLRQSTLFPLFEMFCGARFAPADARAVDDVLRRLPKRIVAESGWTRVCPPCIVEDWRDYGTPIIRLAHQISGVSVCERHGVPLLDRCPACRCPFERKNDLILAPWNGCPACRARVEEEHAYKARASLNSKPHQFARFARRLLEAEFAPDSKDRLVDLYRLKLKQLGLFRKHTIDRITLERELRAFWGDEQIARLDPAQRAGRTTGWFHIFVASATWEVPLGRHLLLSYFLFQDEGAFLSHYRAAAARPAPVAKRSRLPRQRTSTDDRSAAQMVMCEILDASKRIPGCDIDALWQSHYGLMKRLIRHDPQALPKLEQKLAAFDTFQLISVAIVGEDGREFYGECSDFDRALCSDFVREVVLPQLGQVPNRAMPFTQLRRELLDWLSGVPLKRSLCCALTSKAICNSLNT
jgi:TniQ